jgi:membrane protein DedA with SNARE-associated domain
VFVGTFLEELFSPIPSFIVLIPAGVAAQARGAGVMYLLVLMVISAFGRIIAASILYWASDKFEDLLLKDGKRFFGVSHKEIERVGQRLGKAGKKRDWALLFLMNAIPIFPTAALSATCGFLKVRLNMFLLCTFFGTMINSLIYMSIGYGGFRAAVAVDNIQIASQIVLGLALLVAAIFFVRSRRRQRNLSS